MKYTLGFIQSLLGLWILLTIAVSITAIVSYIFTGETIWFLVESPERFGMLFASTLLAFMLLMGLGFLQAELNDQ